MIKFYEALHSTDPDIKSAITSQILEEANTSGWTDLLAVAMTYNSQGKYDDAIVLYKDILKLIANSEEDILAMPDIYLRMSQTLESRGKLDDVHPRVDLVDIHHDGADAAPALVGASPNIKGVEFEV